MSGVNNNKQIVRPIFQVHPVTDTKTGTGERVEIKQGSSLFTAFKEGLLNIDHTLSKGTDLRAEVISLITDDNFKAFLLKGKDLVDKTLYPSSLHNFWKDPDCSKKIDSKCKSLKRDYDRFINKLTTICGSYEIGLLAKQYNVNVAVFRKDATTGEYSLNIPSDFKQDKKTICLEYADQRYNYLSLELPDDIQQLQNIKFTIVDKKAIEVRPDPPKPVVTDDVIWHQLLPPINLISPKSEEKADTKLEEEELQRENYKNRYKEIEANKYGVIRSTYRTWHIRDSLDRLRGIGAWNRYVWPSTQAIIPKSFKALVNVIKNRNFALAVLFDLSIVMPLRNIIYSIAHPKLTISNMGQIIENSEKMVGKVNERLKSIVPEVMHPVIDVISTALQIVAVVIGVGVSLPLSLLMSASIQRQMTEDLCKLIDKSAASTLLNSAFNYKDDVSTAQKEAARHLIEDMQDRGFDVNMKTQYDEPVLSYAVRMGNLPVVLALIGAGANVNTPGLNGASVLADALKLYTGEPKYHTENKHVIDDIAKSNRELVGVLRRVKAPLTPPQKNNTQWLLPSTMTTDIKWIWNILSIAKTTSSTVEPKTQPWWYSGVRENKEILFKIKDHPTLEELDHHKRTAGMVAVLFNHSDMAVRYFDTMFDPSNKQSFFKMDDSGNSALSYAVMNGNPDMLETLLIKAFEKAPTKNPLDPKDPRNLLKADIWNALLRTINLKEPLLMRKILEVCSKNKFLPQKAALESAAGTPSSTSTSVFDDISSKSDDDKKGMIDTLTALISFPNQAQGSPTPPAGLTHSSNASRGNLSTTSSSLSSSSSSILEEKAYKEPTSADELRELMNKAIDEKNIEAIEVLANKITSFADWNHPEDLAGELFNRPKPDESILLYAVKSSISAKATPGNEELSLALSAVSAILHHTPEPVLNKIDQDSVKAIRNALVQSAAQFKEADDNYLKLADCIHLLYGCQLRIAMHNAENKTPTVTPVVGTPMAGVSPPDPTPEELKKQIAEIIEHNQNNDALQCILRDYQWAESDYFNDFAKEMPQSEIKKTFESAIKIGNVQFIEDHKQFLDMLSDAELKEIVKEAITTQHVNRYKTVQWLMENGYGDKLNSREDKEILLRDQRHLSDATENDADFATIQTLVRSHFKVNPNNEPLKRFREKFIKIFNPNRTNNLKDTPLIDVLKSQNTEKSDIVRYLIKHGAWVNPKGNDISPLRVAIEKCSDKPEIIRLLVENGARITRKDIEQAFENLLTGLSTDLSNPQDAQNAKKQYEIMEYLLSKREFKPNCYTAHQKEPPHAHKK